MNASDFFKENGYVVINNFIDKNMAVLLYRYVETSKYRLDYIVNKTNNQYDENVWGSFRDSQAPGDYSKYGDPIFDTLLEIGTPIVSEMSGIEVIPTYSYHRLYTNGTELVRHKDRPSCEISTTLFLGHNISNMTTTSSAHNSYSWPMYVKTKNGEEKAIHLNVGDMIVYRGCEIEHWRNKFKGVNHAQVFLHYNEKNGKYNIEFDGRPMLGLPTTEKDVQEEVNDNDSHYNYELID